LLFGIILGLCAGGVAAYAALDHNPQRFYTDFPAGLLAVFYMWAAAVSFPFAFIVAVLELIKYFRK